MPTFWIIYKKNLGDQIKCQKCKNQNFLVTLDENKHALK